MERKNRTPEENARRAKIRELLRVGSMEDIQNLHREVHGKRAGATAAKH